MTQRDWNNLSDTELWNLIHQCWPMTEPPVNAESLAEFVDGTTSAADTPRIAKQIAGNTSSLEDYALLLEMQRSFPDSPTAKFPAVDSATSVQAESRADLAQSEAKLNRRLQATSRWLPLALTLAASLMAVALGLSFTRSRDLQSQLAILDVELTERRLTELQIAMDTSPVDAAEGLWLGSPSAWYGNSNTRSRGEGSSATDPVIFSTAETICNELTSHATLSDPQRIQLAELQVAAGKLMEAKSTLNAIPVHARNRPWHVAQATLQIVQSKNVPQNESAALRSSAATTLLEHLEATEVRSKVLFNLASLRLMEGEELRDLDFEAAREKLNESIRYWDQLLQNLCPPAIAQTAQRQRTRAETLRIP